jgi:hypothetical protein
MSTMEIVEKFLFSRVEKLSYSYSFWNLLFPVSSPSRTGLSFFINPNRPKIHHLTTKSKSNPKSN